MAGSKESDTEYILKKGGSDIPVEPCKGWIDACEYCDKRFGAWIPEDEEIYEKIPEKNGFFMIGLKNKTGTEVVNISYAEQNINKSIIPVIDKINCEISNKKTKSTKSTLVIRWLITTKAGDKESTVLCAHWQNNGLLPKYTKTWPGQSLLEKSEYLMLSKHLQKWCYEKKDPVWRKSKAPSSKTVEEVKECAYEAPCETCDSYFTKWQDLDEVVENDRAPNKDGLVMLSVVYGKKREVILISCDRNTVTLNIKDTVKLNAQVGYRRSYLTPEKFKGQNPHLEVRWIHIPDVDSDNSCFLYAHFYNVGKFPVCNYSHLPGEKQLDKNKHFVLRNHDKKWLYEVEALKKEKFSKQKNRRQIFEELQDAEDEYLDVKTK